jgi:hypothetical protein
MNCLPQISITREGWSGGRFIGLQEAGPMIRLGLEIGERQPGPAVLQVAPDPLDWVERGGVRRQAKQTDMFREAKPGGARLD